MKKIYLSVVALCFAMSAMAQVQVGPKLGANFNKKADGIDTPEGTKEPFKVGINIGAAFSFSINENFAIAPELIFSQKGFKYKEEDGDDSYSVTTNYIDLPILARVSFGDATKGYVNAGPTFGYWLGGSEKYTEEGESEKAKIVFADNESEVSEDDSFYPKEFYNRTEIGAAIGGGVMFDTGAGNLLLDLRYNAGLTNLVDKDLMEAADIKKQKNSGLSLSIIYLFGTK